jgi:Helix-turn-helix domain
VSALFAWRCAFRDRTPQAVVLLDGETLPGGRTELPPELSLAEASVAGWLASFADAETCEARPSVAKLARSAGCDPKTARTALAYLAARGWVAREVVLGGDPGVTNTYRLLVPEGQDRGHVARTKAPQVRHPTPGTAPAPLGHDARGTTGTVPAEVVLSESGAAAGARSGARTGARGPQTPEPPEFAALLEGVGLGAARRNEVRAAWEAEPERVAACVAEWWRKRERDPAVGVGLLAHMVREGDHPPQDGRRPRRNTTPPCPECEVGGGMHAADCPTLVGAG